MIRADNRNVLVEVEQRAFRNLQLLLNVIPSDGSLVVFSSLSSLLIRV